MDITLATGPAELAWEDASPARIVVIVVAIRIEAFPFIVTVVTKIRWRSPISDSLRMTMVWEAIEFRPYLRKKGTPSGNH